MMNSKHRRKRMIEVEHHDMMNDRYFFDRKAHRDAMEKLYLEANQKHEHSNPKNAIGTVTVKEFTDAMIRSGMVVPPPPPPPRRITEGHLHLSEYRPDNEMKWLGIFAGIGLAGAIIMAFEVWIPLIFGQ